MQFDFLGYGFRPRLVRRARDNTLFWGFNPAVSASALKAMRAAIRELNLRHRTDLPMDEIARQINPRFLQKLAQENAGLFHEPKARFPVGRLIPLAEAGISPAGSIRLILTHCNAGTGLPESG